MAGAAGVPAKAATGNLLGGLRAGLKGATPDLTKTGASTPGAQLGAMKQMQAAASAGAPTTPAGAIANMPNLMNAAGSGGATAAPSTTPAPAPQNPSTVPPGTPTTGDLLQTQFGTGELFQPLGLFGNPLETAEARAQELLGRNLGAIRNRFGAAGLGDSSRAALAEGAAVGEASTALGAELANLGLQNRQAEQGTFANALLGAGQQDLAAQNQAVNTLLANADVGKFLTDLGLREQELPAGLVTAVLGMLGLDQNLASTQTGTTSQRAK